MKVPQCLWVAQSLLLLDGLEVAANPVHVDKHVAAQRKPGKTLGFLAGPSSNHPAAATEASAATTSGDDSTNFILTRLIPFTDNATMHYSCRNDEKAPADLWHLVRPKADMFWSTETVWGTNFTYTYQSKLDRGVHRLSYIGRITGTNLAGEISIMGQEGVFKLEEGNVVPELTIAAVVPKDRMSDLNSEVPELLQNQFNMQLPEMMHNSSLSAVPVTAAAAPIAPLKIAMQEGFYSAKGEGAKKKKPLVVLPVPIITATNNPKPVVSPTVPGPGGVTPLQVPPAENPGIILDPPIAPDPGVALQPLELPPELPNIKLTKPEERPRVDSKPQPIDPDRLQVPDKNQPRPVRPDPQPVDPAQGPQPVDPGHATNEDQPPTEPEPKPIEQPLANPPSGPKPIDHSPPTDSYPVHPEPEPINPQSPDQPPSNPRPPDPPTEKPPPQDVPPKEIPAEHPPPSNHVPPDPPTEKPLPENSPPKDLPAKHPPPSNPMPPDIRPEKIPPPEVQPQGKPSNPNPPNEGPQPVPDPPVKPADPLEPVNPKPPPPNPQPPTQPIPNPPVKPFDPLEPVKPKPPPAKLQPPTEPDVKPFGLQPPKPEPPVLPNTNLKPEEPLAPPPMQAPPKDKMAKLEAEVDEAMQEFVNTQKVGVQPGDPKHLEDVLKHVEEGQTKFAKAKKVLDQHDVDPKTRAKAQAHIDKLDEIHHELKTTKTEVEEVLANNPRRKPKPQIKPARPDDPTSVYVDEAGAYFRKQDTIPGKDGKLKVKYSSKKWNVDTGHHFQGQLQPEPNTKLNGFGEFADLKYGDGRLMGEIGPEKANDAEFAPKTDGFRASHGFDGASDKGWWVPEKGKGATDFFPHCGEVPKDPIGTEGISQVARGVKYNEMTPGAQALRNTLMGSDVKLPLAVTEVAVRAEDAALARFFFTSRLVLGYAVRLTAVSLATEVALQTVGMIALAAGAPGLRMAVDVAGFVVGMAMMGYMLWQGLEALMAWIGRVVIPYVAEFAVALAAAV